MRISTYCKCLPALFLAALFSANAWALPPQVEADRLMLEVKTLMDAKDYAAAVKNFDKIASLKVRLPDTFNYHYGVALAGVGDWDRATRKLEQYLTESGSGGKFYKEALEKYNEAMRKSEEQKAVQEIARQFGGKGLEMVRIPGRNYEIGKYEVTQGVWKTVMGSSPHSLHNCGDTCPVDEVTWNDVQEFLGKLNQMTGKQYRLPNETEWQYACYGSDQTEYCGGNDPDAVGWYRGNSNNQPHPVGQRQANGYGLYDMTGNVWEWTQDRYGNEDERVVRGGSWRETVGAAYRFGLCPACIIFANGFRLARTLP